MSPSQATIAEIMQAYMTAQLPRIASKATLLFSAKAINRLIGNLEPRMVARDTYRHRRTARWDADQKAVISDGTLRREVTVLRAALSWAVREKWISDAPYIEMPPRPAPRDRWLTRDEVDALILAAASAHIRLYIVLGYHTQQRGMGATLDLIWDRVDFERRHVRPADMPKLLTQG